MGTDDYGASPFALSLDAGLKAPGSSIIVVELSPCKELKNARKLLVHCTVPGESYR
uniref:Uncharacterized protein n=1 Tax=Rhizophora mucronata TaxID=61149 RepID=A0A2P2QJE0_RHIMU